MLKINTLNKLLAERSLDSHMLWKGALRWALNSVKKAFHLNDNQNELYLNEWIISEWLYLSVGSREGAREAPAPLSQGPDDPPPFISRSGSGIQRWREERREKWPANYWTTLARRKGQDECCAQNRRTLAEREAAFSILAQVFSFSMLCFSTEPAPQAYALWNVSVEKRHMPVHRCFFPFKYINKQPNKMARFAGCLREDISTETHQSGPDFENMDDAVSLYRKFQGTLFQ